MIIYAGKPNPISLTLVALNGDPIVAGVVNFYLHALSGTHIGKWWDGSGWAAVETTSGAATHIAEGHWKATIGTTAWITGETYTAYAVAVGVDNIPVSVPIRVATCGELNEGFTVETGVVKNVDVEVNVIKQEDCG